VQQVSGDEIESVVPSGPFSLPPKNISRPFSILWSCIHSKSCEFHDCRNAFITARDALMYPDMGVDVTVGELVVLFDGLLCLIRTCDIHDRPYREDIIRQLIIVVKSVLPEVRCQFTGSSSKRINKLINKCWCELQDHFGRQLAIVLPRRRKPQSIAKPYDNKCYVVKAPIEAFSWWK